MKQQTITQVFEELNDGDFDEVVNDSEAVMVMFEGSWCGSCKMMEPILKSLGKEYGGKLKAFKINVDESKKTALKYGINELPTLIFFNRGEVVDHIYGAVPKKVVENKLLSLLIVNELKN